VILAVLVAAAEAGAHAPTTAIGRAVEALAQVPVSYDPGAAVSDVEAANFSQVVGPRTSVAFLPASAVDELPGSGPNDVAAEIAREAALDGTLVVLVGERLGAWSEDIGRERLAVLVAEVEARPAETRAAAVDDLVNRIGAEPGDAGTPWGWIAAGLAALAAGALVVFDRVARRRP
jgi:hypothetical protein